MNPCKSYEEKVFDYAEGILPNNFRNDVETHLQSCPQCSEVVANIQSVRTQLGSLASLKTSSDFDFLLRARIRMERSLRHRSFLTRPVSVPVYATAGIIVVLALTFAFSSMNRNTLKSSMMKQASVQEPGNASAVSNTTTASAIQNSSQRIIKYPMDRLVIPATGIPLNSDAQRRGAVRADSVRNQPIQVQHTYEF